VRLYLEPAGIRDRIMNERMHERYRNKKKKSPAIKMESPRANTLRKNPMAVPKVAK